jgi:hypothetical protein
LFSLYIYIYFILFLSKLQTREKTEMQNIKSVVVGDGAVGNSLWTCYFVFLTFEKENLVCSFRTQQIRSLQSTYLQVGVVCFLPCCALLLMFCYGSV